MRIGLNLAFLTPGESGGMETYARELLPALARRGGVEMTAFVNRAAAASGGPWADVARQVVVDVDVANRVNWVAAEQIHIPRLARRAGVDLIHSLASTAPLHGPVPRITTIHDLLYTKVPEAHFGLRGLGMRLLVPAAARRSRRVIVDARFTRDELVAELGLPKEKIDVVPLAVDSASPTPPTPERLLRQRLDLGEREVALSVSAKRPHKNLLRLLDVWAGLPTPRPVLVIPGYSTPHEEELRVRASALSVAADLRLVGWVNDADLEGLYAMTRCMVFPSLYEGFGLPVLEALRRGVPVACSDRSTLPEVAGDAALLFDPERTEEIGNAVSRLLTDDVLARQLAGAGPRQAATFSWERTAEETASAYRRALEPR